jgi:DNA-binding CsgD family transcriptional regulator
LKLEAVDSPGVISLGLTSILGFIGYAAFVASFVNLFMLLPALVDNYDFSLLQVVGIVVSIIAFIVYKNLAPKFSLKNTYILLSISCMGMIAFVLMLLTPLSNSVVFLITYVISICGIATFGCLWFVFLCAQQERLSVTYVSLGLCAGVLLALLELFVDRSIIYMIMGILPFTAFLCMLILFAIDTKETLAPNVPNEQSDQNSQISMQSTVMFMVTWFQVGYLMSFLGVSLGGIVCLASAFIALVLSFVDSLTIKKLNEKNLMRVTIPCMVGAFTAMFAFGSVFFYICVALLTVLVSLYVVLGNAALVEHVRISKLSPIRSFSKARLYDYLGLILGLLCGNIMLYFAENIQVLLEINIVIAIIYSAIASICQKPRFPQSKVSVKESAYSADEGNKLKGQWKKRCIETAKEHDLSDRQFEIFLLIAQGRNAKYIEEKLHISMSTVQTHIRNIYRKLDVHSRQEMLDLIEGTKLFGED